MLYSSTNTSAFKEQLNQLDDLFQIIESIQKEMITLDPSYNDDDWFEQLDEKVFSVKHNIRGWLKDIEKESEATANSFEVQSYIKIFQKYNIKGQFW